MPESGQDIVQRPQFIKTNNPLLFTHELRAGIGPLPDGFESLYFQRFPSSAPELSDQFDDNAQAIYRGLDPKTVYFSATQQENYPEVPLGERAAIANALNEHGARSLRLAREVLRIQNVEWLGLASKNGGVFIEPTDDIDKVFDKQGYFRRHKATDFAVVGPRSTADQPVSLAMGVSDCLAIPLVDTVTGAFGFAHAGRPGTGLRTAESAVDSLTGRYKSTPKNLVAFLGEGVCTACYDIDETTFSGFVKDFGGRTAIDKVVEQYPNALGEKQTEAGNRIAIDLYAFNKYLLAERGVGTIIMAPNCTARMSTGCTTLTWRDTVPAESEQEFYSHARAKGQKVGWTMQNGEQAELDTFHLGTPRNLATLTRS